MIKVADLKSYLKIASSELDSFLQTIIDQTVDEIKSYCRRNFIKGDYYDYLANQNEKKEYYVKNYPLDEILEIKYFNEDNQNWEDLINQNDDTIANSTLILSNIGKIILLKGYLFKEITRIKYRGGYEFSNTTNLIPNDLQKVVLELSSCNFFKSAKGKSWLGIDSQNIGGASSEGISIDLDRIWENSKKILDIYSNLNI